MSDLHFETLQIHASQVIDGINRLRAVLINQTKLRVSLRIEHTEDINSDFYPAFEKSVSGELVS